MKCNAFFVLISGTALAAPVLANPVDGDYFDGPECDSFGDLVASEELGTAPVFPSDELIAIFGLAGIAAARRRRA